MSFYNVELTYEELVYISEEDINSREEYYVIDGKVEYKLIFGKEHYKFELIK